MKKNLFNIQIFGVSPIAILALVFIFGGLLGINGWPPFSWLKKGYGDTKKLVQELKQSRPKLLKLQRYTGDGVVLHHQDKAYSGYTMLQGVFSDGVQMKLIDMDGKLVHVWPIDFSKIWPNPTHLLPDKIPTNKYSYHSQGNWVLPDGSVIVNLGYLGTVKLDKCSNVLWTVDRMTRHFVQPTGDGNYYVGANREIDDIEDGMLLFGTTKTWLKSTYQRYENTVLTISQEGDVLDEFSVLKPFFEEGLEGYLFDVGNITRDDLTHHNDIEVVTQPLAMKIKGVEVGDLLVSIRNMHMLAILDKTTKLIKWTYRGAFTRQHDPDIMSDGSIVVFNNSRWDYGFNRVTGSSLTRIDPADNNIDIIIPTEEENKFYTSIFGTHQLLPNGNILVSEGLSGRAFEIDQSKKIVWSYISNYDDTHASIIEDARRYNKDYFSVDNWQCPIK